MQVFQHDHQEIRYVRSGTGQPLVMLHNGGTSHAIWDDITPRLEGYEVFALDLLGFGASSKPEGGYELSRYVAMLGAFIEAHGLRDVSLIGNCMGSATALAYAMQKPEAVRALVLINILTTATFKKGMYGRMLGLPDKRPTLVSLMSKVSLGSWIGKYSVRTQLGRHGIARRVHERKDLCACYAGSTQSRSLLKVLADIPNYAELDRFSPPASFPPICTMWGLENKVLRAQEGRALVETLRPARQEWLEGCGHLPMLEQPERVAGIIEEFLGGVAARAAS